MRIALVAGELSGDLLGAGLIAALRVHYPHAEFIGVGGPAMLAQGLHNWVALEKLAVMGLVEVLQHLPELLRIRRQLVARLLADPPAVFIGIDAPDFNLGLAHQLRLQHIPTVHYVSPSVWAWRPWRIHKIARAIDLMLTLLPFEADFYRQHSIAVRYVGHPLADEISLHNPAVTARQALGLSVTTPTRLIALLPGSRHGEVSRMAPLFLQTARCLLKAQPQLQFLLPAATPALYQRLEQLCAEQGADLPITLFQGRAREVMAAADAVLLASGTATLEAMLIKRPLVVAYRVAGLTAWIARRLVKVRHFSLPNLLAGRTLVPEFFQAAATPEALSTALLQQLHDPSANAELSNAFTALHEQLRRDASAQAAAAVVELLATRSGCA